MAAHTVDIDALIDRQNIWRVAVWVLLWAAATMAADGYDLLSISYVAPRIIAQWGLTRASFGPVFSAANLSSMLGGLAAGVLADRIGRRRTLVLASCLLGVSTLGTALAHSLTSLILWRTIAGVGLGAVPPIAIVLANEFAPARLRSTFVAVMYLGNALGATLAGVGAGALIPLHGWQVVFLIGGIAPLIAGAGVFAFVPESLRFLTVRRPDSLELRGVAQRLAGAELLPAGAVFVAREAHPGHAALSLLFVDGRWRTTLLLWAAYFTSGVTLYSVINWEPTFLEDLGITPSHAALIASLTSLAGWCGGMIITRFMDRFGLRAMVLPPLIGVPLVAGLGYLGGDAEVLITVVSLLAGAAFAGGHTAIHAAAALLYPTATRGSGVAMGLIATRLAGVIAPTAIGMIYGDAGGARVALWVAAAPLIIVSVCFVGLDRLSRQCRARLTAASLSAESP